MERRNKGEEKIFSARAAVFSFYSRGLFCIRVTRKQKAAIKIVSVLPHGRNYLVREIYSAFYYDTCKRANEMRGTPISLWANSIANNDVIRDTWTSNSRLIESRGSITHFIDFRERERKSNKCTISWIFHTLVAVIIS